MRVSITWLKELVEIEDVKEAERLLPLRTIATKEITDDFIELDMKGYNRADLLSMRGVAREVAAITGSKIKFEDTPAAKFDLPTLNVQVENPELCPIYCLAKIENLQVKPSSPEWVKRLADSGVRSINNVADVTNLMMLEYGQPMHAFDAGVVKDETIVVRRAKAGEILTTLDGKVRELDSADLLITDPDKPLGLAGVMGGKDSEVSDQTTTILLEAAIFDPINIRQTTIRHNLPSEASKRFQHGLTKTNLLQALAAAIKMYKSLGGKLTAITLIGNFEDSVKKITLTQDKINSLIGVEIKPEEVEGYLASLGFHPRGVGTNSWEVEVPYWRLDINIEEDLIEEVARMYGYERIPAKELVGEIPDPINQKLFELIRDLKDNLVKAGLTEVQTYSFYSTDVLENFSWDKTHLVKIANPISSETEYLREDIWPNLVEVVSKNMRHGFKDIGIFEIGKVYNPEKGGQPSENYRVSLALMNGSNDPTPELYQIFQSLNAQSGIGNVKLGSNSKGEYESKYFHPTRFSFLEKSSKTIGGIAEVHPRFTDKFGLPKRVAVLEFELETLH